MDVPVESPDTLHLVNYIDRLKLEHKLSKSMRAEIPFVVSFILVFVFLFLERPRREYLDLLVKSRDSMELGDIQNIRAYDEAILALKHTHEQVQLTLGQASTVVGVTTSFLSFSVFPTGDCRSPFTSQLYQLWAENGLLDLTGKADSSPLRCFAADTREGLVMAGLAECKAGQLDSEGSKGSFGVILPCEAVWTELENTSKYGNFNLKIAFYGTASEFLAVLTVKYSLNERGIGEMSTTFSALPAMKSRSDFGVWQTLGLVSCVACFISLALDTRRTVRMAKLIAGKYKLGWLSYKQFLSGSLLGVAVSRLVLHAFVFDQFRLLANFYRNGDFDYKTVASLYAAWDRLSNIYSVLNLACLAVCILCSHRVLEIPHAHPRIAMLSETFALAKTQLINFACLLVAVMTLFALVANLLFKTSDFQRRFSTIYKTMQQQGNMLVGFWPLAGAFDTYNTFLNICYLVGFGFLVYFVLLAFYQTILVENFKRYKLKVEENVTEHSFFTDILSMCRGHIKTKFAQNKWPHRLVLIAILEMLRDQAAFPGETRHVHFSEFEARLNWFHGLTTEDIDALFLRDPALTASTKLNLLKCVRRGRNRKYDPVSAGQVWSWYAKEACLQVDFSLDAQRPALRCKQVLKDLEAFRVQADAAVILMLNLTAKFKEAASFVEDRRETLDIRITSLQREINQLQAQLDEVDGTNTNANPEIGSDERLLLGLIRVLEDQNKQLKTRRLVRAQSLKF